MIIQGKSCDCSCCFNTLIDYGYIFRQKIDETDIGTGDLIDFNGGFSNGVIEIDLTGIPGPGIIINSLGIYEATYYITVRQFSSPIFLQLLNNGSIIPASTYGQRFNDAPSNNEVGIYGQVIFIVSQTPSKIILINPSSSFPFVSRSSLPGEIPITASLIIKRLS